MYLSAHRRKKEDKNDEDEEDLIESIKKGKGLEMQEEPSWATKRDLNS